MRLTPLVIAATSVALVAPAAAQADSPGAHTPAAPGVSVPGGRYEHSVELKFRAERGTTVRYTLDGTTPTRDSRAYSPAARCGSIGTPMSPRSPSGASGAVSRCPTAT
ncbi:chitobiase/beta-hexosaminidase C-terminal domain-containing protein [Streptomyces sanglieri]|uniref:Chitobiase/beta-hexosaminidase C-terminal domain-containing protein n=1 Tax=Streptomyces sanglieri TaxID=193460 RepID=A0ABW2XDY3_9ACTN